MPNRSFDEHMILEMQDKSLSMFVRIDYGIGVSYSYDGGRSRSKGHYSALGGPSSRFFIRRLKSGRVLLINHYNFTCRNNLTALLQNTILHDAVDLSLQDFDSIYLKMGCEYAIVHGINEALCKTGILKTIFSCNPKQCYSFLWEQYSAAR